MPTNIPVTRYPFDPIGTAATNKIVEEFTINDSNRHDYNFYLPQYAPFYTDGIIIERLDDEDQDPVELEPKIDYYFGSYFRSITKYTLAGKEVAAFILFDDPKIAGRYRITYQTLGGSYTVDGVGYNEIIARYLANPITSSYEELVGRPLEFPSVEHQHHASEFHNAWLELIAKIDELVEVYKKAADKDDEASKLMQDFIQEMEAFKQQRTESLEQIKESINRFSERLNALDRDIPDTYATKEQLQQSSESDATLMEQKDAELKKELMDLIDKLKEKIEEGFKFPWDELNEKYLPYERISGWQSVKINWENDPSSYSIPYITDNVLFGDLSAVNFGGYGQIEASVLGLDLKFGSVTVSNIRLDRGFNNETYDIGTKSFWNDPNYQLDHTYGGSLVNFIYNVQDYKDETERQLTEINNRFTQMTSDNDTKYVRLSDYVTPDTPLTDVTPRYIRYDKAGTYLGQAGQIGAVKFDYKGTTNRDEVLRFSGAGAMTKAMLMADDYWITAGPDTQNNPIKLRELLTKVKIQADPNDREDDKLVKLQTGGGIYASVVQVDYGINIGGLTITKGTDTTPMFVFSNPILTPNLNFYSITNISDARMKREIKREENLIEKAAKLSSVSYKYLNQDREQIGFIAQELKEIDERLVVENDEGILSIDPIGVLSILGGGFAELVNTLKDKGVL